MVLSCLFLFLYSLAKTRCDSDSSVDCFHEAATSSKNDKMCCSLRERKEQYRTVTMEPYKCPFTHQSITTFRYKIQFTVLKCVFTLHGVITPYSILMVKTILKAVWHLLVQSMVSP